MKYTGRIDVKPITEEEINMMQSNMKRLGIKSKSDYFRMLIHLDFAANIVTLLNNKNVFTKKEVGF